MADRFDALVDLALEHGPCSVRHLFYRAVVDMLPGITKNDSGYNKVQNAILRLRREGRIPYELIVDSTRWMRMDDVFDGVEDALTSCARTYRRDLWSGSEHRLEVWCESDSIASTIADITNTWTVPLMVCRGYTSETFAYNAADLWRQTPNRSPVVLYIGDHDPAGLNIEKKLQETLAGFYGSSDPVVWSRIGVTWDQIVEFDLPGTTPKREYGFPISVEAEALPPRLLREMLEAAIVEYIDGEALAILQVAERAERATLLRLANRDFAA
jgi:hypothetical protein